MSISAVVFGGLSQTHTELLTDSCLRAGPCRYISSFPLSLILSIGNILQF